MKFDIAGLLKKYQHQIRYLLSGTTAAVLEFGSFNLLFYVIFARSNDLLLVAQVTSYLIGFTTAFVLHNRFSFKTERKYVYSKRQQLVGYAIVSLTNLGLTSLILVFLKNQLGVWPWLAKIITMGLQVIWNFFILNGIIFKSETKDEKAD